MRGWDGDFEISAVGKVELVGQKGMMECFCNYIVVISPFRLGFRAAYVSSYLRRVEVQFSRGTRRNNIHHLPQSTSPTPRSFRYIVECHCLDDLALGRTIVVESNGYRET